jgi:micrococcal nuclease
MASSCRGLICLLICLLLVACQPVPVVEGITLQVQQVLTGRDLEVAGVAGQPEITERVRLEGIDVPDLAQQPWGRAARDWLQ